MNVSVKHISFSLAAVSLLALSGCKNGDISFDDYAYTSACFATQNPKRTLVMGEDFENDNSLDNQHKCKIGATMGGSYHGANVVLDIAADNSLCDNLYFDEAYQNPVKPMPSSYYNLASNQIKFEGDKWGFVEVEFTDAYFADPLSVEGAYVIPLKITGFSGVDKIIDGVPNDAGTSPALTNADAWSVAPQNYTLYNVTYMSKYAGWYLRRGKDRVNGKDTTRQWKNDYRIDDEVVQITTNSLNKVTLHLKYLVDNVETHYDIALTFDGSQNCTISSDNPDIKVSGSGKYEDKGAGKYWGDRERDQLTLSYTIEDGKNKITTEDILVTQRRGVTMEYTDYFYKSN
jgi:hypothetical protein